MNQLSSITPLEIILIALAALGIFFFFRVCWRNIKRSRQHLGLALLTLVMTLTVQTAWAWNGDGTEASPYQISTVADLVQLATDVNSGTTYEGFVFKLMNNIDFNDDASRKPTKVWDDDTSTEQNFPGIGGYNGGDRTFHGTFNGNNKTISGIRIYSGGTENSDMQRGLFGRIGSKGTVKNLTLSNARITGYTYTGGIAGKNFGMIDNCHVTNTVCIHTVNSNKSNDYHGGVAGHNANPTGIITNCTNSAKLTIKEGITAGTGYGGIVGYNTTYGTLSNNFVSGATIPAAKADKHGAIAGWNNATMTNNYYTGCTVAGTANASNVGCNGADVTTDNGAIGIGVLALGTNVTASGSTVEYNSTTYYYGTVTLGYSGTVPTGGIVKYAVNGEYISGNEFTISCEANVTAVVVYPYADISVLTYHGGTLIEIDGTTYDTAPGGYYEIADEQDLIDLSLYVNAGNNCAGLTFKMTADLDFSGLPDNPDCHDANGLGTGNFLPIAINAVRDRTMFCGHFEGDGHSITGLRFSDNINGVGLFSHIYDASAVIEGVTIVNPRFSGALNYVGGIVGFMNGGTVRNCTVVGGTISANNGNAGGIVGYIRGGTNTISDCTYHTANSLPIIGSGSYTDGGGNQQVYQVTLGEGITAAGPAFAYGNKAYYAENATVTLGSAREGYALLGYQSDDVTISNGTFTMPAIDVSINANWADPNDFSVNAAGDEYTIKTAAGWNVFCDLLEGGTSFTGKTVYLDKDISVTRMAGSSSHKFTGTFDGQGNVLTVSYGTEGTPINEQYAAPFSYVDGATIQNLSINGDIYTSAKYAAGIVSSQYGTVSISNCRVSINIHSSISGDGTHAGFVALNNNDATLNIEGCVFSGKLLTTNGTYRCAGYVGWRSGTVNISNSLYAPVTPDDGETWAGTSESATFVRNGGTSITNSYYTADFNDGSKFTAQGKQARSITAGENVTVANAGNATEYTVSGITSYGAGIKYGSNLYAGSGDEVSLTLSHGDREGYTFDGYTASAGTLSGDANPYTLTMPDENVTIGATFTKTPVTTSYVEADGTLHENVTAMPLDNSMTTLAAGWYVVNEDVTFTSKITLDGDVNLILGDGKTMTVTNTGTDHEDRAIYGNEKTLHIYGQSQGTGALTATAVGGESAIFLETSHDNAGSLLGIHGGVVSASTEWTGGVGISVQCATDAGGIVIDGGQVTASGKKYGIYCEGGHFDIIGGQVTATGTNFGGLGICDCSLNPGVLTLGYSKASDFVSTNSIDNFSGESFVGEVKIADDQTLVDGNGNIWSGTLSNDEIQSIHNQTLRPVTGVALTKDGNGTTATFSGTSADELNIPVAVEVDHVDVDRTFAANKACTLYLPFGIAASKVSGGKFYTFTAVDESTTPWSVEYDEVTGDIEANTPYIFLPDGTNSGKIVVDNGSDKVSVSTANPHTTVQGQWEFVGTYEPIRWLSDNERAAEIGKIYGFAAKDKTVGETSYTVGQFVKIASGASIKPMRAYLKRTTVSGTRTMTRGVDDSLPSTMTVVLKGSSGNTTEIGTISLDDEAGEWYSLDGRKLSGKPTKKGLYINGGKKIVIK